MPTLEQITRILSENKDSLVRKYNLKEIGVFGSYVRKEQTQKSDLDILIEYQEEPGMIKYIQLENYLSDLLGVKVDLAIKGALKPFIGKNILKEVIYL
jgi:predicted nucleotidyltransferase